MVAVCMFGTWFLCDVVALVVVVKVCSTFHGNSCCLGAAPLLQSTAGMRTHAHIAGYMYAVVLQTWQRCLPKTLSAASMQLHTQTGHCCIAKGQLATILLVTCSQRSV